MIGSNFVLDTSAVIELFKGNPIITSRLETEAMIKISSIVLGELYFGAHRSSNLAKHIDQIERFTNNCEVVLVDIKTAEIYADTKSKLLKKGKPIPENDIWIAATAIQHNLLLVAFDKHFLEIDNLKLDAWQ